MERAEYSEMLEFLEVGCDDEVMCVWCLPPKENRLTTPKLKGEGRNKTDGDRQRHTPKHLRGFNSHYYNHLSSL
jgi:hypothetical protein